MTHHKQTPDLFSDPTTGSPEPAAKAGSGTPAVEAPPDAGQSAGARLRAAREAKGLTISECAANLHLPVKVLRRLEADDFGSPEHFVFLRGALKGYSGLLGLPSGSCDDALRAVAPDAQPALVSVARTSHTRWLLQRYGTAATYIVLTATIAVPLVLLGLRGGLQRPTARIVSLDQAASAGAPDVSRRHAPAAHVKVPAPKPEPGDLAPLRASMTPFSAMGLSEFSQGLDPERVATPQPVDERHTLMVTATTDCWVEVTDADGNTLASELLHAGESRTWRSTGTLHVVLGNAGGVSVSHDGKPLDLDGYRRGSVARFDVFATPAGGGSENH